MTKTDLLDLYQDIITVIDSRSLPEQAIILLVLVCVFLLQTSSIPSAGEISFTSSNEISSSENS